MRKPMFIKDSLYNCHPQSSSVDYAKGCLVGLVSGLMSCGFTFETAISELKANTLDTNFSDLTEQHVIDRLPECWKEQWNKS